MIDFCKIGYADPRIKQLNKKERLEYVRYIIKTDKNLKESIGISDIDKKKHMHIFIDAYFNSIEKQ